MKVLIWADNQYWNSEQIEEIINSFQPLEVKVDKQAAIGAGASGPYPEFHLLLILAASQFASGFLQEVGEDAWNWIKEGVKKIRKTKPIKIPEWTQEDPRVYELDLIWWIQAGEAGFLITINTDSEQELDNAFDLLPSAVDDALMGNVNYSMPFIYWTGEKWEFS